MDIKKNNLYHSILERILFFEYKPGELLNEKSLAEEFGVSRTPVREVLNRLEWESLVRIIPRSGSIVTDIEFQKIRHVFQVRLEHEAFIGRLAAENVTDEHLNRMYVQEKDCLNLLQEYDPKALMRIDFRFRDTLYEAASNPVLRDISMQLYNLTVRLWYMRLETKNSFQNEVKLMADEIRGTIEALEVGDAEKVAKVRQHWLRENIERMKSQF
jgi:DNA-binding GntR family transcriptional regulator